MTGRTNTLIGAAAARCLLCLLVLFVLNFLLYGSGTADARVNRGSNSSKAAVATGALTGNAASTSTASGTGYRSLASPNRSAPATLPPIPAGMPAYFNFGLFNSDVANVPPSTPWDFRYQYLAGGANTGDGWATWSNPPGQYAINYIQDARSRGMIPAFMYYQILQSAPYYDEYQNMQSPSTMYSYFADWKLLMTKSAQAGGGPIVVMLEADLTGVMQQLSTNDDAATVAASVAASGFPDAAGYPNNFRGMYQAMLHIRDLYAPGVLVTLDASSWGPGDDIVLALRDDPNYNWQLHADRTAAFLNSTGPGFDMISWNPSDRDAAWYQSQGSNRWWDFNNVTQPTFNTMGGWLGRIVQDTNKRALMWQVPNGNRVYRSENNTDGHWQDNKTEYFLNPTSGRQHIEEWANLGVMGIWWGAGVGSQSHYYDAKGDGITNPPPINGNTEVAQYADDDGGYIRLQSDAYYSQGPVVLPGGTPPSPTVAPTGTPPSPTVAPTGTPPTFTRTPTRTNTPVVPPTATFNPSATSVVYTEGLLNGWQNWSWGSAVNLQDSSYRHSGQYSLSDAYTQAWGGLQLGINGTGLSTAPYNYLLFYINGGANSGQQIEAYLVDGGGALLPSIPLDNYIVGGGGIGQNVWKLVQVPLSDLSAVNIYVTAIALQDSMGGAQPRFYVDDMLFSAGPAGGGPTPTSTPSPTLPPTQTPVATVTPGPCGIRFTDINPGDYFYDAVVYLFCNNVISGYPDNTFRPYNTSTRAQLAKMVVLAESWILANPANNRFADVPPGSTFYPYVETAAQHGLLSGYPCGGALEPCDTQGRPYFRPANNVTRGEVAKIVVLAESWILANPANNRFADVPPGSTFYPYVETAAQHGLLSGYPCGGALEPCDTQGRPYFRLNNSATRGQLAKIIYTAVTGY